MTTTSVANEPSTGPPPYDPAAVGAVAKRIDVRDIELVHSHFDREDEGLVASRAIATGTVEPEIMVDLDWATPAGDSRELAYLVRFGALQEPAFRIYAFFRMTYDLDEGEPLSKHELEQFGFWNVVFNAWPYFREFVSSIANRAAMPRLVLPVMRVPRQS